MLETTAASPLTPMTPDAVMSAFDYLQAVEAGATEAAVEFVAVEPRMPAPLVDVAERITVPVIALPGPDAGEPRDDTFALVVPVG